MLLNFFAPNSFFVFLRFNFFAVKLQHGFLVTFVESIEVFFLSLIIHIFPLFILAIFFRRIFEIFLYLMQRFEWFLGRDILCKVVELL